MRARELNALDRRLERFLTEVTVCMGRSERRLWASYYIRGLLLDGQRKSIEPLAQRTGADVQALQQFIGQSPWPADQLQKALNRVTKERLPTPQYWVIDETSFPKQGTHSVGVAHQYCGALGKLANCQVAVSLHASTNQMSWPLGWRLYLPQTWIEDSTLRSKGAIPKKITYKTKPQLAIELIEEALSQGLCPGVVLADQLYGESFGWRAQLKAKEVAYCVATSPQTSLWIGPAALVEPRSKLGRPPKRPPRDQVTSARDVASQAPKEAWQEVTWRQGTRGAQTSRFYSAAVCVAHRSGKDNKTERWTEHLLIEWPADQPSPIHYWLCWLKKDQPQLLELVSNAKARWRVEQDYRELKEELGLDHFEGRGWVGWHHHVALVTLAFVFLRLEQQGSKKNEQR
jgi:SRSO17 transposase